jgi:hypothetical protein
MNRRVFLALVAAGAAPLFRPVQAQPAKVERLMLVHGRAQGGRSSAELKTEWLGALNRGALALDQRVSPALDVSVPFYGDLLDRFVREFDIPLISDVQSRGSIDDEFLAFQAQFAEDLRRQAGVTDAQVDAEYGTNPAPRGPQNWQWVQAILRALDKNSPFIGQATLEAFTRDVFLYLTRSVVRDAIDAQIRAALTEEPTIIVSHSLGTVVTYNVLRSESRAIKVPLLLTLGSPLGVRSVRDRLMSLSYPKGVRSWFNAFDARDVVSLYALDQANFGLSPAIENYPGIRNHTSNRHGIDGYLDDGTVVARLLKAMSGSSA